MNNRSAFTFCACLLDIVYQSLRHSSHVPCCVLECDYTLWPFWVDTHVTPPFRKKNGGIVDAHGQKIKTYTEVPQMLEHLHKNGYKMAVASRTGEIEGAEQLLQLLDWNKYFQFKEIYPGAKTSHFSRFKKNSGFDYEDMLFFDDEQRNIRDISQLNVTCILVGQGMNLKVLEKGLNEFKKNRKQN